MKKPKKLKFEFREDAHVGTSETYYDLFDGGRIKPEKMLKSSEQAAKVTEAVKTIEAFLEQAREAGVLEEY